MALGVLLRRLLLCFHRRSALPCMRETAADLVGRADGRTYLPPIAPKKAWSWCGVYTSFVHSRVGTASDALLDLPGQRYGTRYVVMRL
jgi:hypothetical protein